MIVRQSTARVHAGVIKSITQGFVLAAALASAAADAQTSARPTDRNMGGETVAEAGESTTSARGAPFFQAKYAMFVHFGLYSQPGSVWKGRTYFGLAEWLMHPRMAGIPLDEYKTIADRFDPRQFDARAWVKLAKDSGMRYIVVTSKHHDGFAMFGSRADKFDIVDATPFRRDLIKELAAACKEAGIGLGFYYSQYQDWHAQGGADKEWTNAFNAGRFEPYFQNKVVPQVTELLEQYGPVSVIWFDTPGPMGVEYSRRLVALVRKLQPNTLINSRVGNGEGDYTTLGDSRIPPQNVSGLWEAIDTTNHSWGYSIDDTNWKTAGEIAERLVQSVARGGSFMLNVGPRGDGSIPAEASGPMRSVGKWLATSESIYGALPSPWGRAQPWGDVTARKGALYLHVLRWPSNGRLHLQGLQSAIRRASVVGQSGVIETRQEGASTVIVLPHSRPAGLVPVIRLDLADDIARVDTLLYVDPGLATELSAPLGICTGCTTTGVRWMEKFGEWRQIDSAAAWAPGASIKWEVAVPAAGIYRIEADYSADEIADYGQWRIDAGGKGFLIEALDSGHRATSRRQFKNAEMPRFRTATLGQIALSKSDRMTLSLAPQGTPTGRLYLAAIRLIPVQPTPGEGTPRP